MKKSMSFFAVLFLFLFLLASPSFALDQTSTALAYSEINFDSFNGEINEELASLDIPIDLELNFGQFGEFNPEISNGNSLEPLNDTVNKNLQFVDT